jgi:TubC N-terminal docking domain
MEITYLGTVSRPVSSHSQRGCTGRLRRLGVRAWIEGDRLEIAAPKALPTDDLRAAIREHSPHRIANLMAREAYGDMTEGTPLLGPGFKIPLEWRPAREYTAEEHAVYDVALREMAEALTDAGLVHFVHGFCAVQYLDERLR